MVSQAQLRYQLDAAERLASRLRQDGEANPELITALESLAAATQQRLALTVDQALGRDPHAPGSA